MVLPRDFWDKGGFGNGGVVVSVKSSGEDTSARVEMPDSLPVPVVDWPAVDWREDAAVGVGEAGIVRGTEGSFSVAGREEVSVGDGKF
jgi:hypothetical protein